MNDFKVNLRREMDLKFGFKDYKNPEQKTVTEGVYKAIYWEYRDVFIDCPSGFGKSLCFQLPILTQKNSFAIVFTPTIALAQNQVDYLTSKNISAYCYNTYTPISVRQIIVDAMRSDQCEMKFLYITLDQVEWLSFELVKSKLKIAYVVIDEVHCISSWSHCFKDSFESISKIREVLKDTNIIAVTSTVTTKVKDDIYKILKIKDPLKFVLPNYRQNLIFDVRVMDFLENPISNLKNFIIKSCLASGNAKKKVSKPNKSCGIIFCENEDSNELCEKLSAVNINTLNYNQMRTKERLLAIRSWNLGECHIIVASSYLGIGISNPSVRFVAHWGLPKSIPHLYQESGRAGHDGNWSYCRIYFSIKEIKEPLKYAAKEVLLLDYHNVFKPSDEMLLGQLVKSITYLKCRHSIFSSYFGEDPEKCATRCDVCLKKESVGKTLVDVFKKLGYSNAGGKRKNDCLDVTESKDKVPKKAKVQPVLQSSENKAKIAGPSKVKSSSKPSSVIEKKKITSKESSKLWL